MGDLITVNVRIDQEQMITDSRNVSEVFGKQHRHVLESIRTLERDVPNFRQMFFEGTLPDSYGREQTVYFMNRDGFTLLAMGFTGSDAMKWKIKYIEAFNLLEKAWNSPEQIMARALKLAQQTVDSLKERCKFLGGQVIEQQKVIEELQPKATYYDMVLQCKDLISTTVIAKDYGMSATKLNKILHEMKVQFKQGDTWVLYAKYQGNGYLKSKTHNYADLDGIQHSKEHSYWTQKGRLFLYDLLKKNGILPLIEREEVA